MVYMMLVLMFCRHIAESSCTRDRVTVMGAAKSLWQLHYSGLLHRHELYMHAQSKLQTRETSPAQMLLPAL